MLRSVCEAKKRKKVWTGCKSLLVAPLHPFGTSRRVLLSGQPATWVSEMSGGGGPETMFRLFIANAKGTFFGMSESLKESSRRWNSSHVPYDSTNIPEKIYIPYIPNSKMLNAKWIKRRAEVLYILKSRLKEPRERKSELDGSRNKPFSRVPTFQKGQRTEGPRASDIRTGESS